MKLSQQLLHRIHRHLESGYPNESLRCDVGKGWCDYRDRECRRTHLPRLVRRARNRYLIDPLAYLKIEREADKRGLDVLGIYHSHPDVAARPSQFDLDHAWPNFSYLIVSVVKGKAVESNSWRLRDDRSVFDQEAIEIS